MERRVWSGSRGASRALLALFDALPEDRRHLLREAGIRGLLESWRKLLKPSLSADRDRPGHPSQSLRVIIISSLLDVFPVLLARLTCRSCLVVAPVYHLVPWAPNPEPLSLRLPKFLVQRTAVGLASLAFDAILTENSYLAERIRKWNPRMHMILGSPGVPRKWFPSNPSLGGTGPRDIDVLFLSAFKEAKGVDDVLRMWEHLRAWSIGQSMVIAGYASPFDEARVRDLISGERTSGVILRPNVSEEEKFTLLQRSKLVVLPSYMEGIPYVFYEAMAYGARVVTYALPTYCDLRGHISAVPPGDILALAEQARKGLLDYPHHCEEDLRRNYEFARHHIFEEVIQDMAFNLQAWAEGSPL